MKQKTTNPTGSRKAKVVNFVTTNLHKFEEAQNFLENFDITLAKLDIEAVEIQDDHLENIAKYSALDAVKNCGLPVFVEDAGLFIESLKGFPGPYSKFVFQTVGVNGILKLMDRLNDRNAYFKSVICYAALNQEPICFVGKVEGKICSEIRGEEGFGYDPIFVPSEGDGRTFAEMSLTEKNSYSHRARALKLFADWFSGC
ncbi:MAG: XTP/dITP diphosphatase [Candidatus Bathyarchaeota archaeon]|nr:XTP/dITP diphosphatase [Candidatus Bathyarchaeum sp.]